MEVYELTPGGHNLFFFGGLFVCLLNKSALNTLYIYKIKPNLQLEAKKTISLLHSSLPHTFLLMNLGDAS